jgi:hypothetical protein
MTLDGRHIWLDEDMPTGRLTGCGWWKPASNASAANALSQLQINNLTIDRVDRETLSIYRSTMSPRAEIVTA